jgi:hypothetical protein
MMSKKLCQLKYVNHVRLFIELVILFVSNSITKCMNTSEYSSNHNYQKGYADGYKRHRVHILSQHEIEYNYFINVFFVFFCFIFFIIITVYVYNTKSGINSNYKGECLNNLATNYMAEGCLDN